MAKLKKYIYWLMIVCFSAITIFLTFNKHSRTTNYSYTSEIWADKAGYYIYLPAILKYDFDAHKLPKSIDVKTGGGFSVDYHNNKINTRYTYGVALLQLPFYLVADALAVPLGYKADGFSKIYSSGINLSAVFYLLLGLIFLRKYLLAYFENRVVNIVLGLLFLATNLFYYSIDESGMSHIYSFSLFSIFLYLLQRTDFLFKRNIPLMILIGVLAGLIVVIRPTNLIFLSTYFFLDVKNGNDIIIRMKRLINPKVILPAAFGLCFAILPQMLYWYYLNGSFVNYSYGEEGFNWLSPKIIHLFFSPNNGLFLYTPFYFLILMATIYMIKQKMANGIFVLVLFCLISYIFSSWWAWNFGCGFGARSYVEYLVVFSVPLAHYTKNILGSSRGKLIGFGFVVFTLVVLNLKMIYSYDKCFIGGSDWDWQAYTNLVVSPTK